MTLRLGAGRDVRGLLLAVSAVFLLVLTGCTANEPQPVPAPAEVVEEPTIEEQDVSSVPDPLPEFVTAKGVVLATVIIATGNVSSAIEQGLVSPQEVDLARKAIAEGTVQDWVDAAEKEQAAL